MPLYVDGKPFDRRAIRDITDCPKCKSLATSRCTRPDGADQDSLHKERWRAAELRALDAGKVVRYTYTPKDDKESPMNQNDGIILSAQDLYRSSQNASLSTVSRNLLASQAVFLKLGELTEAVNVLTAEQELARSVDRAMAPAGDDVISYTRIFTPRT